MSCLLRKLLMLALSIFMFLAGFSGEVRFLHLNRFEGQSAQLIAADGLRTVDLTVTVQSGTANYDIPAGQWDMSLYLPGAVPLVHVGKAVPDAPASIGIASFVNAHIGGTLSGNLLEGSYIADSSIQVAINSTLTIEAGSTIIFAPISGINVAGRLQAVGSASNRIRFLGQDGQYWSGLTLSASQFISHIRNTDFYRTSQQAVYASHAAVVIDSCSIQQCGLSASTVYGVMGRDGADISISNTEFNGKSNLATGGAIAVSDSKLWLSHCLLANQSARDATALISVDNSPLTIANCILYGNNGTGAFSAVRADNCSAHRISITNSIFAQNTADESPAGIWLVQQPSSLSVTGNVFYANNSARSNLLADNYLFHSDMIGVQQVQSLSTSTVLRDPMGNIWEDPQFEDPSAGDFRLRATSPVIRITKETVLVKSSNGSSDANSLPVGSGSDTSYTGLYKYVLLDVATYVSQPIDFANWDGYVVVRGESETIYANGSPILDGYYIVDRTISITTGNNSLSIEQTPPVKLPVVDAGRDAEICAGESYLLSRSSAANYTLLRWTTDGDGVFSSTSVLHPEYTPGTGDMARGAVILTLYAENGSPVHYELNRMVLSIQPRLPLFAVHEIQTCSADPIVVEALYGQTFVWNTGSHEKNITVTPSKKTIYSLDASVGSCILHDEISIELTRPYGGPLLVSQLNDVVNLDIAADNDPWVQYQWTIDDTVSVSGKRIEQQFLNEGLHQACLSITDNKYGCNAEICADITYSLPRFSLGGQIFCGKYPAQSASSQLFRLVNGRWVLTDSSICRESAFFHYPQLPVGIYTVRGILKADDPSFGSYAPTFFGGAYTVANARQLTHYQNSWKTDISLIAGTGISGYSADNASVYWEEGYLYISSAIPLDQVSVFSANGVRLYSSDNIGRSFSCEAQFPPGHYVAVLQDYSGNTESASFLIE